MRGIHKRGKKVRSTGSLLDKHPARKHLVLTEEKLYEIGARLENTLQKSVKRLAQKTSISKLLILIYTTK
jgi:hypothetical protein